MGIKLCNNASNWEPPASHTEYLHHVETFEALSEYYSQEHSGFSSLGETSLCTHTHMHTHTHQCNTHHRHTTVGALNLRHENNNYFSR